jgi:4-hydroxy-L-threonine phosphate dehydrogenase PdxA
VRIQLVCQRSGQDAKAASTAFDITGKGVANAESLIEAIN